MTPDAQGPKPGNLAELFLTFTFLALRGFGGVLPVAQAALVDEKRWLTLAQFRELLSFSQVLPGPNVCNLSLMVGERFFGVRGALVALAGMLVLPAAVVLSLAVLYSHYNTMPIVRNALDGMSAVAAGLMIGTALRLAKGLTLKWWAASAVAFGCVALLHIPLIAVLGVGLPLLLLLAWERQP
jgi:chromate transporter